MGIWKLLDAGREKLRLAQASHDLGWRGLLLAGLYAHYVFLRTAKVWEMRHAR